MYMKNIKVTQLSIEEVKKKIYDNNINDMYVLVYSSLRLFALADCQLISIIRYMSDCDSAFLKIEVIKE